nr:MAG TPA: hypothetical protein [Crassvirales sp.]
MIITKLSIKRLKIIINRLSYTSFYVNIIC